MAAGAGVRARPAGRAAAEELLDAGRAGRGGVPGWDGAGAKGQRWYDWAWITEENFQAGKGLAGLDEHRVRHWTPWYRWVTLEY